MQSLLFKEILQESQFEPFYIIGTSLDRDKFCDNKDNTTHSIKKARRFRTKEEAEAHIQELVARPPVDYNPFDKEQVKAGCPGGEFMHNSIYKDGNIMWDRSYYQIIEITKNDWEKIWQDGINEYIRQSSESSNVIRTILEKGKPGKVLYRIIDEADRLYSEEKEHIVNLRITCTTSDPEKLLYVANATGRDAVAVVEFSDDTIAYEMKKTESQWTEEAEHLIFGKFKVIRQDKPFILSDVLDNDVEFVYFKAIPLDQSPEFAKQLVKKRINHYKDNDYDTDERLSSFLYKRNKIPPLEEQKTKGDNMDSKVLNTDLFSRVLKEADEAKLNNDLLKKYEKENGWDFVDDEDFPALNQIANGFATACKDIFGSAYNIVQFNPKTGDGKNNTAFVRVNGYGYRGEVNDYRMHLAFDQTTSYFDKTNKEATSILDAYRRKLHKKDNGWHDKDLLEKYAEKKLKPLSDLCEKNGFKLAKIGVGRVGHQYDSTEYLYIDLKPEEKLNKMNNMPVDQKLQRVVDILSKGYRKLAEENGIIYWIGGSGSEGSTIIFSTHLTTDEAEEYPSDDFSGSSENGNYGQPILYLDVPNMGYANWNSGTGYITGRQVKTMDDIRRVVNNFKQYLSDVGNQVYNNSNY